jgi:hypothetical protein
MSRGLGSRQREVLDLLVRWAEQHGPGRWVIPTVALASDGGQNRTEQEAIRRALRTLEARGLIEVELEPRQPASLGGVALGGEACPARLKARLPLSVVHDPFNHNSYPLGNHHPSERRSIRAPVVVAY